MLCYENGLSYPVYASDQNFHNSMNLLPISCENKSYYVYIKDFNRFMCNKTKNKNKKHFCKCCLQYFSSEKNIDRTQIKLFSNKWWTKFNIKKWLN